jgi:hypothetical protein
MNEMLCDEERQPSEKCRKGELSARTISAALTFIAFWK